MSKNCWEHKKCGREPGGSNSLDLGICPATTEKKLDKINNGNYAGRSCWALTGTMCGGKIQGTYAAKFGNCLHCDFYRRVVKEEGKNLVKTNEIIRRLNT